MLRNTPALLFVAALLALISLGNAEKCEEGWSKCVQDNVLSEYDICIGGEISQSRCPGTLVCRDVATSVWNGESSNNVRCSARPFGDSLDFRKVPRGLRSWKDKGNRKQKLWGQPTKNKSKPTPTNRKGKWSPQDPKKTTRKAQKPESTRQGKATKKPEPTRQGKTTKKPEPTRQGKATEKPEPTRQGKTTKKPEPTRGSGGGGGGGGGGTFSGEGTYYDVGLGSCGKVNSNGELVAALNGAQMGNGGNSNNNPNCGRKIKVNGPLGSVVVTIVDTCPPCKYGDVDLSPTAFEKIGKKIDGRIPITWSWA